MKQKLLFLSIFICGLYFSQNVGINTADPQITLDVRGIPADNTKPDGLIAPRLTRAQLNAKASVYSAAQTGAIVYITNIAGGTVASTVQITTLGYYYFDGTVWKSLEPKAGTTVFTATLGNGAGATTNFTAGTSTFVTVPLPAVVKNIGGGVWNAANNTYAAPVSGTYIIKSTIRLTDGSSSRNVYQAVNTVNSDIPDGVWQTNSGSGRWTMLYTRIAYFNQGDLMRLYMYSDGTPATVSDASLNISLLSPN
jgi:hypothetical protein